MTIFIILRLIFIIWLFITILGFLYLTRGFTFKERQQALHINLNKDLINKYGQNKLTNIRIFIYLMIIINAVQLILFQPIMDIFSP